MGEVRCPTPGCDGDGRYAPPGRGHAPDCVAGGEPPSGTRIDYSETSSRCWRSDHNVARLLITAREEAHAKHGANSIEAQPANGPGWLAILVEEVGEVAQALTYDSVGGAQALVDELIDVAAVATAWVDAFRLEGVRPSVSERTWLA